MQVSKKIPFDDPQVLLGCRILYVVSNVIIVGLYLYIQQKINSKKGLDDATPMLCCNKLTLPFTDLTTLKYVEPAAMGSGEEPKLVTTTVQEYDTTEVKAAFKSQLMGVGMMGFMHLYLKYTNPLLIQSIIPVKGAFESNLVKIYILGQPASGDLKRPWKASGGFPGMGQGEIKSDKASIEAAEKSGRGGAKEE